MRKRLQIALAVLLVMLAGVVVWQGLREREPVYQERRLSVWLHEYRMGLMTEHGEEKEVQEKKLADGAVRQIGTYAIPTLLKMLGKKDSFVISKLVNLWAWHISRIRYLPAWVRYPGWYRNRAEVLNDEAESGFAILGANAQQAVAALITLYEQNISPHSQAATGAALNAIGPAA